MSPHSSTSSVHGKEHLVFPQGQLRSPERGHEPHAPAWHTSSHVCTPQSNVFPHTFMHCQSGELHGLIAREVPQ